MNNKAEETMISIWSDIFNEKNKYLNDLYNPIDGPIDIRGEVKYLSIWNDFFSNLIKLEWHGMMFFLWIKKDMKIKLKKKGLKVLLIY